MKTRIRKEYGLYYPEVLSWGFWFKMVVDTTDSLCIRYNTSSLDVAKQVIDNYLKAGDTEIIEYP